MSQNLLNWNLLFKLDIHFSEIENGFPMLENGGYTDIAMTVFVSQRAFLVNNGLDKLNWHVAEERKNGRMTFISLAPAIP